MNRGIFLFFIFLITPILLPAQTAVQMSVQALTLDETLDRLGGLGNVEFRWDPFFQSGTFAIADHSATFEASDPGVMGITLINGTELLSCPNPYVEKGQLRFPEGFVTALRDGLEQAFHDERVLFRIAAIIIDPGHGGKDTGAIATHIINGKSTQILEKNITLKVSLELYGRLSRAYPDKRILLTRNGDTYPSLEERVDLANSVPLKDNEAIIYISIHANSSFNKHARGYEVWYLTPDYQRTIIDSEKYADDLAPIFNAMLQEEFTAESISIARSILSGFEETLGNALPSRGIKPEAWYVVRNAHMPAVLVELGFITNETDAALMLDEAYLKKFSEALYKGIMDFVKNFERNGGLVSVE
ncbi:MAG: N-acetylmuramoyl-L-alanine amidase [Treponema sp.]|jgi:N-acetylmuramoyl-L-alanine amidase|nr:N-acetylmuramoyl-L-alanine amidase [Treponema sp.]